MSRWTGALLEENVLDVKDLGCSVSTSERGRGIGTEKACGESAYPTEIETIRAGQRTHFLAQAQSADA